MPTARTTVSATPSQGTCPTATGASISCALGTIASGASATISLTVTSDAQNAGVASRSVTNTATDSSTTTDPNSAAGNTNTGSKTTTITRPLVSEMKTADKSTVKNYETITYTITLTNAAGSTAYDTRSVDHLDTNTTYVAASATTGSGITTEYSPDGTNWFGTESGAGGAANIHYVRWTVATTAASSAQTLSVKAALKFPTKQG